MSSETQSCELFLPDTKSEKNEKIVILTKKKLILLMVATILILGILMIPIFVHFVQLNQENMAAVTDNLTKVFADIEVIRTNETFKRKMDSKNSYANFLKAGEFGYFQKLDHKMGYFDGQDACRKIHGKIIESDDRYGNASSKF